MAMIPNRESMYQQDCSPMPPLFPLLSDSAVPSALSEATNNLFRPAPLPPGEAFGNAKKKRRTTDKTEQLPSLPCLELQDLRENPREFLRFPQPSGYGTIGNTVVVNNPFDDSPMQRTPSNSPAMPRSTQHHSSHPQHHLYHDPHHQLYHDFRRHHQQQQQQQFYYQQQHHYYQQQMQHQQQLQFYQQLQHHQQLQFHQQLQYHQQLQHNQQLLQQQQLMGGPPMHPMTDTRPMISRNTNDGPSGNPINSMGMSSNEASLMGIVDNHPMNRMSPGNGEIQQPPMSIMNNSSSHDDQMAAHLPFNNPVSNPTKNPAEMNRVTPMMPGHVSGRNNGRNLCPRSLGLGTITDNNQGQENLGTNMGHLGVFDDSIGGQHRSTNDFAANASETYSNDMSVQMNPGNFGRNTNIGSMNIKDDANEVEGLSIGNIEEEIPPIVHPIDMEPETSRKQGLRNVTGTGNTAASPEDKIYPVDQQIIFNTQNRNGPPIYVCRVCHKEVRDNDQGIVCESGCNFWFHRTCAGLTNAAFKMLTKAPFAEWACDKCFEENDIPPVRFT